MTNDAYDYVGDLHAYHQPHFRRKKTGRKIDRGGVGDRGFGTDRDCPRGHAKRAPASGALHGAYPSRSPSRGLSPDDDMPGDPHDGSDVYDPPQTLDLDDDGVLPRGDDAPRGLHYVVHLVRGAYAPGLRMGHVDALQMVGDPRTFVRQTVPPRAD